MLPLQARVDLGPMATKGFSVFPKDPALWEIHYQISYLATLTFDDEMPYNTNPKRKICAGKPGENDMSQIKKKW